MGSIDEALDYFNKALAINRKINNVHSQAISLSFIGDIFEHLNQLYKAANSHEEALKLIEKTNNFESKGKTLGSLARIYNAMGDYKKASQYYADLINLQDSIHSQRLKAVISEIDAKYESEKKIQHIEQLKQENEIQELKLNESRIITYSFAALSFSVLVIALLLIQRYRIQTKQKNSELEQKLFRIQMNPHFIFNALNAIQSFTYKNDPLKAGKYLSNFSRLIRLVLNNSREEFITLDAEIRTLDYYLQLQRLRFNNKFDYSFNIDPLLHPEIILVPPMLAQPFIENSIEHGIQHITTKGNIRISFTLLDDWIRFEIEDNGIGIYHSRILNTEKSEKHESLALSITEERLKVLNRSNPKKIELLVRELNHENDESKGTSIIFSIPYRTMNNRTMSSNSAK
jgi:LytS/YehU family sensor histidine kinase